MSNNYEAVMAKYQKQIDDLDAELNAKKESIKTKLADEKRKLATADIEAVKEGLQTAADAFSRLQVNEVEFTVKDDSLKPLLKTLGLQVKKGTRQTAASAGGSGAGRPGRKIKEAIKAGQRSYKTIAEAKGLTAEAVKSWVESHPKEIGGKDGSLAVIDK